MKKKSIIILAALVLSALGAARTFACSRVCVGGPNSDGTYTVCTHQGGGTWTCMNVQQPPAEE